MPGEARTVVTWSTADVIRHHLFTSAEQARVNLIFRELAKRDSGRKYHRRFHEALRPETGSTSYKDFPTKVYETATAFLADWLAAIEQAEARDRTNHD